jgi:ATP-dependent RNA helicase RhlE
VSATFKSLGLSPESLGAVRRARFSAPTPIQAQAIPPALAGRDVIGCAATGTGKTAAYLLPLVERLQPEQGTQGLVLAPTRELVQQIAEQAAFFGAARGLTQAVVLGQEDARAQRKALEREPTLLLATPGRLADLLEAGVGNFSRVRTLVLDEADRMLEMGFRPELQRILAAVPREHQTLLFSATLGHDVTRFAQEMLRRPVRVEVTPSGTPAPRAEQRLFEVEPDEKYALLRTLLAEDQRAALVFTRTRERATKVLEMLKRTGHKAAVIHSDRTRGQRRQALEGFKKGQYRCLVATDLAARGLDVEDVGHVINFDLPHSPADYVHRIGRTARMGASGLASTFATERDAEGLRAIERVIHMSLPLAEVPREDPVFIEELAASPTRKYEPLAGEDAADDEDEDFTEAAPARAAPRPAKDKRPRVPSPRTESTRGGATRGSGHGAPVRRGAEPRRGGQGSERDGGRGESPRRASPSESRRVDGAFGKRRKPASGGRGGPRGAEGGKGRQGSRSRAGKPAGQGRGAPRGAPPRGRGGAGRRGR